jgi:hypothetical protein
MKNGDYFKGIFRSASDNLNNELIKDKTSEKGWDNFGFYDDYWYYMENNDLYYSSNKPQTGNEITYQEFEDWILDKQPLNPQYEVY